MPLMRIWVFTILVVRFKEKEYRYGMRISYQSGCYASKVLNHRWKNGEKNQNEENEEREWRVLIPTYSPIFLVFKVLPNGKDVLSRSTEVPPENLLVRVGEQLSKLLDLSGEVGACRRVDIRRRAGRATEKGRALESVASPTDGWRW